jgi:hypothetical protein
MLQLFSGGENIKWGYVEPGKYYRVGYNYIIGGASQGEWNDVFENDPQVTTDLSQALSEYKGENVLIWGSHSWLYDIADIRNPIKYVANFHITKDNYYDVIEKIESDYPEAILVTKKGYLNDSVSEREMVRILAEHYSPVYSPELKRYFENAQDIPEYQIYELDLDSSTR